MTSAPFSLPATALLVTLWFGLAGVQQVYAQPTVPESTATATSTPDRPVVRRIVAPGQATATVQPDSSATPPPPGRSPAIGETTRRLLAAQANPDRQGTHLPILGATAQLSWQRYLDSFRHPQPEWFDKRLEKD